MGEDVSDSTVTVECPCCQAENQPWPYADIGAGEYDYTCPRCGSVWRVRIGFWDVTPEDGGEASDGA